jgi:hypothetical protein
LEATESPFNAIVEDALEPVALVSSEHNIARPLPASRALG